MFGTPRRLPAATVALLTILALPATAWAGDGKPKHQKESNCTSAVCVYREQQQSIGGPVPVGSDTGPAIPISSKATRALAAKGGSDAKVLAHLATHPGYSRPLPEMSGAVTSPGMLDAALNLGTGPIALLAGLAGSALFLLAYSGRRGWRHWRNH